MTPGLRIAYAVVAGLALALAIATASSGSFGAANRLVTAGVTLALATGAAMGLRSTPVSRHLCTLGGLWLAVSGVVFSASPLWVPTVGGLAIFELAGWADERADRDP